jgi:hypothetical protein
MKLVSALIISSVIFSLSSYTLANANDPIADSKKLCHHQAVEKSAIQGKSLLKGAAIGAAVGAAAGGAKKNKDKKQAVLGEANYKTEYDNCLRSRGLVPENVR